MFITITILLKILYSLSALLSRSFGASFVHCQSRRVGEESFHVPLEPLGNITLAVLDRLIGGQHDGGEEVIEAFSFLGRILGPVVDLAEVVKENHSKPNAAVTVGFVPRFFCPFFHSLLEFGPVVHNELVQHEGLVNGLGQFLGLRRAWVAGGRHGSRLEVVRKC